MSNGFKRRDFLKGTVAAGAATAIPLSLVEVSFGMGRNGSAAADTQDFTFAYISDSHLTHVKGTEFNDNFDKGLKRAVTELNFMSPKPDFVIYGGDLSQLGKKEELDHGLEIMSGIRELDVKWVIGEHDYYLDLGEYWRDNISDLYYSFDHKGVHFVVLNSILTYDEWTHERWPTAMDRMKAMARLDNPEGSPFMVGAEQRKWLADDLAQVDKATPIVVLSHSPLYQIFRPWNFWTEDAKEVQAILEPFDQVNVLHGHVHQIMYNQIGNITFQAMMATAWPWPYPVSYAQHDNAVPKTTVFMNRADPHNLRDGTGWGSVDLVSGRETIHHTLWRNTNRTVKYDPDKGHPVDTKYQDPADRIPPQDHY